MKPTRHLVTSRSAAARLVVRSAARLVEPFRAQVSAKLGLCPYCVRASLYGTIASWAVVAAVWIWGAPLTPKWPVAQLLLPFALLVALAFSLLAGAHLAAFLWRVSSRLKSYEDEVRSGAPDEGYAIGRRAFLSTVARAGVAFTLTALIGRSSLSTARAQTACGNKSPASLICADGPNDSQAIANLAGATRAACDALCPSMDCPTGFKCLRSGAPIYTGLLAQCSDNGLNGRRCCVRVECPCACATCKDSVPPDAVVSATADNKGDAWSLMLAAADNACVNYCSNVDSCAAASPVCKPNGAVKVKAKQKTDCRQTSVNPEKWTCTGTIENCPCGCKKK